MSKRSLVASGAGIKLAKQALERKSLTQKALKAEVILSWSTVNNFFNQKPIDRINFEEICTFLDLDWHDIVAPFAEKEEVVQQTPLEKIWQQLTALGSPTEQMGLVLVKEETLGWGKKIGSYYEKSVRLGNYIQFEINLQIPGYLLLIQKDTCGQIWCFCPSPFAPQPQLENGKTSLPQMGSPMTAFPVEGKPGKEQILAIISPNIPNLQWLLQESDEVLELTESHLMELINHVNTNEGNQILYTEYQILE
jgi:DNA-binding Xre family transcriptional regulator